MLKNWAALWAAFAVAIVFAVMATTPPGPRGADTPAGEFSSARAMEDVRIIAAAPHPTGSHENAKVRTYLQKRMAELGMEVSVSEAQLTEGELAHHNKWNKQVKSEQTIYNLIGVLPGEDRTLRAVLLMAHHDTVWGSPGAADDTVGIASIFEIIRALKTDDARKRDVIVLLTDAEEIGLIGAKNFFRGNPLADRIGAVINFEARGGGGTANMFQTSADNGEVAKVFARAVSQPSVSSLSVFIYNVLPNDTDLTMALERDYAAYNIANIGRASHYHSHVSDADALGENTLQHMGSQGLDLTRALAATDAFPGKKPDAVFFDLFGWFTIIYAPFWGWVFLLIALAAFAASITREPKPKSVMIGAVKMVAFIGAGGGLLYGLNVLSIGGEGSNYYDRLAAIPKLSWMVLGACTAVFFAVFGRAAVPRSERFGLMLPLFMLGAAGQAFAPTASYFIVLALMLCGIAAFISARSDDGAAGKGAGVIVASLIAGYMLMLGHLLMLGVGPDVPSVAILPAAIAVMALLPLYPGLPKKSSDIAGGAALMFSLAMVLWIRLDPIAASVPVH